VATVVLLLALLDQYDRAAERIRIPESDVLAKWSDRSEAHRKLVEMISNRRNWSLAFEAIDHRLGIVPADPEIIVSIEDSDEARPACSSGKLGKGVIRFNMRILSEYQRRLDEIEREKKAGKQFKFLVPPMKMDGVIAHELTHVVCGGPTDFWIAEGLACYVAADDVVFYHYNHRKLRVDTLDHLVPEEDAYARGMAFFLWLEKEKGAAGVHDFTRWVVVKNSPPPAAAASVTGEPWEDLILKERNWSAEYISKFKSSP